jgi:hypothetical protein
MAIDPVRKKAMFQGGIVVIVQFNHEGEGATVIKLDKYKKMLIFRNVMKLS